MEFGLIKYTTDYITEIFHIHSYYKIIDEWNENQIISTHNFLEREYSNIPKRNREHVFEEIRKEKFMEFPSRSNCLFVTDSDNIKIWENILIKRKTFYQLVEIEMIDGKYIKLDDGIYDFRGDEKDGDLAYEFWNGYNLESDYSKPVILFEGVFKIKKIIKQGVNTL